MARDKAQRIVVWGALLVFLLYLLVRNWNGLHNGLSAFPPLMAPLLALGVIAIAIRLYRPIRAQPWVRIVFWGAISVLVLDMAVSERRHLYGRHLDPWLLSLVILTVVGLYRALRIGRWVRRLIHRDSG